VLQSDDALKRPRPAIIWGPIVLLAFWGLLWLLTTLRII